MRRRVRQRDRRRRVADVSTALFVLDEAAALVDVGRVLSDPPDSRVHKDPAYVRSRWRRILPGAAAALMAATLAGSSVWWMTHQVSLDPGSRN